jgi:hypothetical protein
MIEMAIAFVLRITLNPAGNGWVSPALEAAARRR